MCDFLLINCYHVHICIFDLYATQSQLVDHQVLPDTGQPPKAGLKSKVTQCKKYTHMLLKNPQIAADLLFVQLDEHQLPAWSSHQLDSDRGLHDQRSRVPQSNQQVAK